MGAVTFSSTSGDVPGWVAGPPDGARGPGVVVLHDAGGMTRDLREQAGWLASEGFWAAAPDLYRGGAPVRCMVRMMRDLLAGREDEAMAAIESARTWLIEHPRCTGKVGVIGFCMGGGFALMLASRERYDAASVNYGGMSEQTAAALASACPIVASYGGRDPTLRGAATRLRGLLRRHGVVHDVKEYPEAGHGFMNDHPRGELPWAFTLLARASGTRFDPEATRDARARIVAFFREHLRDVA
ncbi:MAG: dienelactone hydrolase family protein [Myxococcales bacterium]|nr:dienelactone hydrolase family protein [Myxococcales bacterium]